MAYLPQIIADSASGLGVSWHHGPPPDDFLPATGSLGIDLDSGDVYKITSDAEWVQLGAGGTTATTLAGYGITDAYTKAASDARYQAPATTLAGYGITDAYTKTAADARYRPISYVPTWSSVTGTPTTIAGYGITDAYTKTASDARYQAPATTLAGYGITDAYTKTASDARYLQLSGGGTISGALTVTGALTADDANLQGFQVATIAYGSAAPTSSTPGVVGMLYGVT